VTDRAERLGAAIQVELAGIVAREVKDPRVHAAGLLTVTRVQLSADLRVARVYVSFVGGGEDAVAAAIQGLEHAAGFLRGEIGRRLSLRHAPELRFVHDRSAEAAERIERLLRGDEV
jgi:ribosome-binding factor A